MTQLITTNNQQHVSNVTDDVGMTLLHLSPNVITLRSLLHLRPNVITLRSLLHLRAVITFRSSTGPLGSVRRNPESGLTNDAKRQNKP